jgi:hypothetical protein
MAASTFGRLHGEDDDLCSRLPLGRTLRGRRAGSGTPASRCDAGSHAYLLSRPAPVSVPAAAPVSLSTSSDGPPLSRLATVRRSPHVAVPGLGVALGQREEGGVAPSLEACSANATTGTSPASAIRFGSSNTTSPPWPHGTIASRGCSLELDDRSLDKIHRPRSGSTPVLIHPNPRQLPRCIRAETSQPQPLAVSPVQGLWCV